jgi:hypothetical protein
MRWAGRYVDERMEKIEYSSAFHRVIETPKSISVSSSFV